ncbi:MAG: Rab family GTPase [Rubricoccaceae bacterium]
MIQKKICLIGVPAVGKTSLVRRFVQGVFSEAYLTTIGVKIDRREVEVEGTGVRLVVWDIAGDDAYSPLNMGYLRGAAGLLMVADGTRPATLDRALELAEAAEVEHGPMSAVLALNKADLVTEWALDADQVASLRQQMTVLETSAKTGDGVEAAFDALALQTLQP